MAEIPKFELRKMMTEDGEGLDYFLKYEDPERPEGIIRIAFEELNRKAVSKSVYKQLKKNGLKKEDKIAYLSYFCPYGDLDKVDEEQFQRLSGVGVGSLMLGHVIQDSLANGAKAIYLSTYNERMGTLALKNGFMQFGKEEELFCLLLA